MAGPPAHCIDLTPTGTSSQVITGVLIEGNFFLGLTGDPPDTDTPAPALAAIRIGRRAHLCSVNSNFFRRFQYANAAIDDSVDEAEADGLQLGAAGVNTFVANSLQFTQDAAHPNPRVLPVLTDIFPTGGGGGWSVFPI
jgi:hypothetical protein